MKITDEMVEALMTAYGGCYFEGDLRECIAAVAPLILGEAAKEIEEQARLNGMGAERELALHAKLEAARRHIAELEARAEDAESGIAEDDYLARIEGLVEANRLYRERMEQQDRRVAELEAALADMKEREQRRMNPTPVGTTPKGSHYYGGR